MAGLIFWAALIACDRTELAKNLKPLTQTIFKEVTEQVKLDFIHDPGVDGSYFMPESIGSGAALLDFDNDGDLDIYLVNCTRHGQINSGNLKNRLFRQEQNGTFSDVTEGSGLGDPGYGMGAAVGDFDNDGDVDVYVSNYGPDALYRNNGNGTFSDISAQAGIRNHLWGCSVIFLDYNLDGYLDIFVTNYLALDPNKNCMDKAGREDYCGPGGFPGVPDVLYHNNGDGTFSDVSVSSKIASESSKGLGVVSADFNRDNFPDLYVANDGDPNHLWINQKDGTFKNQGLRLGAALNDMGRPEAGMGIALGDIENDGDLDLFVTHVREESNTFYRFGGDYGFQDDSSPSGLAGPSIPFTGFGTGFFDFDHDGDLDLALVNGRVSRGHLLGAHSPDYWDYYAEPNFIFENDGSGSFRQLIAEAVAFTQPVENSRALAFGDIDNDGDIDLLVTNEGGRARLYLNVLEEKGNWLTIKAVNPQLNRDALGAKITVTVDGKKVTRLIARGYSFLSSNDPRAHFGLGDAAAVDQISITWPDGTLETFPGVSANQFITLSKGSANLSDSRNAKLAPK